MLRGKLYKHALIYAAGSIIVNGGGFLLIPVYTKYLTPGEYGICSSINIMCALIISVLGFGIHGTINRFYYKYEDPKVWRQFFSASSKFVLLFGFVVTLLLFFIGGSFLDSLFKSVRFEPYLKLGVVIGYLGVIPMVALALFQAKQKPFVYRTLTIISFILLTFCIIYFVVLQKKGVLGVLYSQLISGSCMGMLCLYFILKEGSGTISIQYLGESLFFGLPLMFYTVAGFVTEMGSKYFIERFATLSDLGVFNLAQQYASGLIMVVTAISMAWTPIFYEKANKTDSKTIFEKFGLYLIGLVSALGLFMSLFAPEFMMILASNKYNHAQEIIPVLLLSYVFGNGFWVLMATPIMYTSKTKYLPWLTGVSSIICVVTNIILIPTLGLIGAAIAQLISYIGLTYASYIVANRLYPINYDFKKIGFILLISIGTYLISLLFGSLKMYPTIIMKSFLFCAFVLILIFSKTIFINDLFSYGMLFNKHNNES